MKLLLTLLLPLTAMACSATVVETGESRPDDDTSLGAAPVSCDVAFQGDACDAEGDACGGITYDCLVESTKTCVDGVWELEQIYLECPTEAPEAGAPCEPQISVCVGSCDYGERRATCEGTWVYAGF